MITFHVYINNNTISCKANTPLLTGVYTDVDDDNLSVLSSDDEDFSTEQEAAVHEDDVSLYLSLYIFYSVIFSNTVKPRFTAGFGGKLTSAVNRGSR